MKYSKEKNKIVIESSDEFNPQHILECGQVFRYKKIDNDYIVYSKDKFAKIIRIEKSNLICDENSAYLSENQKKICKSSENKHIQNEDEVIKQKDYFYEIISNDIDYFENYFDLKNSYKTIKTKVLECYKYYKNMNEEKTVKKLSNQNESKKIIKESNKNSNNFLCDAISYGSGIRILNQDRFEAIISFVISQNNNIKRIQLIIERLCSSFGTNLGDFYAFPTINQLDLVTKDQFTNLGLGYRAEYMVEVIKALKNFDYEKFNHLEIDNEIKFLLQIKGIGPKVADCILLFGFHKMKTFPVDTWIEKVYNQYFIESNDNVLSSIKLNAIKKDKNNIDNNLLIKNSKLSDKNITINNEKTNKIKSNRVLIRKELVKIFGEYSGYAQQYLFYFQRKPNA